MVEPIAVIDPAPAEPLVIDELAIEAQIVVSPVEADPVFLSVGPVEEGPGQTRKMPEGNWYLETPEGLRFGPASREEIAVWVSEGRVSLDCRLQRPPDLSFSPGEFFPGLKVPTLRGKPPTGVRLVQRPQSPAKPQPTVPQVAVPQVAVPQVAVPQVAVPQVAVPQVAVPQVAVPQVAVPPPMVAKPAELPVPDRPGELTWRANHRGFWILLLAVCSWATCPVLGGLAWLMATHDLQEIRAGRMDSAGEPETSLGMWLGMGHVIVSAAILVIGLIAGSLALAMR